MLHHVWHVGALIGIDYGYSRRILTQSLLPVLWESWQRPDLDLLGQQAEGGRCHIHLLEAILEKNLLIG